uniref:(northern house mosquito) hypothetical protein n=1 Tax=Culex pipiens TaxID=7175 RepID=A0A8D8F8R9_CULPI
MNWKRTVSSVLRGMKKSSNVKGKLVYQPITVQDLPDDIFLEIFSHLSSDYYKVTSLVCRRWNSVTFGTNQVQLNVTVLNRDRSMEKAYLRLLSKSKRRYKNLKLADCQRSLVLKLLPKFSSNLNSLTLSCNFELKHLPKILQH